MGRGFAEIGEAAADRGVAARRMLAGEVGQEQRARLRIPACPVISGFCIGTFCQMSRWKQQGKIEF